MGYRLQLIAMALGLHATMIKYFKLPVSIVQINQLTRWVGLFRKSQRASMTQWYVVQTKVKQETIAEQNLANQSFNPFLPWLRTNKHVGGRWQSVREPLFPGYLFVELDVASQNTAPIHSTRGVVRLVRHGSNLQAFPESQLRALMEAQDVVGDAIEPASLFKAGDDVRLLSGPMTGMSAIFMAKNSQERVVLLLSILGNETQISVSPEQIVRAG